MKRHVCNYDDASLALRQYTKALEGTRKSLVNDDQPIIVTLISCILFCCFEILRRQLAPAAMHLRNGLNILRSSYVHIERSSMAGKAVVEEDMHNVFAQLGFQVNYFVDRTHSVNQTQIVSQLQDLCSHRLEQVSTLEEAQASLYACLNETMFSGHAEEPVVDAESSNTQYHMTRCAQLILYGEKSPEFAEGREKAIYALEEWHTSFNALLLGQQGTMSSKDIKLSTLLKLHHLVAMLMLTTACGCRKETFNLVSAIHGFEQVLRWVRFLIAAEQSDVNAVMPAFSADVGIIAPLFFVATRCPDPALRMEAEEILASGPRREGMWDAEVAVMIIQDINVKAG